MAGLFLSHSSKDKVFVQRFAIDLVNAGVQVWFDVCRLEAGDLLSNEIYSAVDASSILLLVLSPDSVNSEWVEREVQAALTKEGRLGRKFLVPVKLRDVELPAKLADRIFIDFSASYTQSFEGLLAICEAHGLFEVQLPPEKQIVPLTFTKGIFLNRSSA